MTLLHLPTVGKLNMASYDLVLLRTADVGGTSQIRVITGARIT